MLSSDTSRLACVAVAKKHDLPLILHTRKAEARTFEILQVHLPVPL